MPASLGIVGGGRAAWAFASCWSAAGWPLAGLSLREGSSSPLPGLLSLPPVPLETLVRSADVLLLAVSDSAIESLARTVAPLVRPDALLFHASGSLTSEVFAPAPGRFSLHPLRALPPVGAAVDFRGTLLVFEGSSSAKELARDLAVRSGALFAAIDPAMKIRYHAGAVFAANFVAALLDIAADLQSEAGIERGLLRPALTRLALSAIENWSASDGSERFTGPVARGDAKLVESHLEALGDSAEEAEIYRLLSRAIAVRILRRDEGGEALRTLAKWLTA